MRGTRPAPRHAPRRPRTAASCSSIPAAIPDGCPIAPPPANCFQRVPRELPDGRASTVFDEFLISLSGLAPSLPPGVLIASGDVLLVFDHLQLTFRRGGVIGVAAATPAEIAGQHGVFASGHDGSHRVAAYLHKPDAATLTQWAAVADDNTVQIDTGLVWLDQPTMTKVAALAPKLPDTEHGLNLYGDLLVPLAESTSRDSYLTDPGDGVATPEVQATRRIIWEQFRGTPFTVERLQPAAFIHFRTSAEYWQMVAGDPTLAALCGWNLDGGADGQPVRINASVGQTLKVSQTLGLAGGQPRRSSWTAGWMARWRWLGRGSSPMSRRANR